MKIIGILAVLALAGCGDSGVWGGSGEVPANEIHISAGDNSPVTITTTEVTNTATDTGTVASNDVNDSSDNSTTDNSNTDNSTSGEG